ncbi:thiol peroxidase [Helcobacillus massiliensis]|uniref:Thiol peroxidase n=1 Tax=Helcobacillus massiliensis TaxID=521392 RepID=A0A839QZH6_9MICO|nr:MULTISPECIES: thiol peroxidase [Helcobacillus]MBB3022797.1 thiol peroxidase [Helcobacillus massiliensis]MCG7427518.1 thiol peroxidase [Helcobacillus sp. ACRRO]MCT1558199.1 thiol peroxidase [Helcobacillus massiliensis]MCT2036446.1 thiol peroxidase [Helcobacillus massiliensis]MCT2332250.1 thiol peroxidase [Helcobacillus massiliensis]
MAQISLRGEQVETVGDLPKVGEKLPDFTLVGTDLSEITKNDFAGKRLVLNIFPSIDTGVCQASVREFNKKADGEGDVVVLAVSKDLPFAFDRFCGAEGIDSVVSASAFRSDFGEDYGVTMTSGGLKGLLSRSVVVADEDATILYTEQVPEIGQEPDYDAAWSALTGETPGSAGL